MDNRPACYFYKRGWCRYGKRCRYSHDDSPAVSPPPVLLFVPERPSSAPTQPCQKPEARASGLSRSAGTPLPPVAIPATAPPVVPALAIVAPPVAKDAPPSEDTYSSEYSIFGGPDHFAPLLAAIHSVSRMNRGSRRLSLPGRGRRRPRSRPRPPRVGEPDRCPPYLCASPAPPRHN